jgi:hypothetical protein
VVDLVWFGGVIAREKSGAFGAKFFPKVESLVAVRRVVDEGARALSDTDTGVEKKDGGAGESR